jgi:hypothetical protein
MRESKKTPRWPRGSWHARNIRILRVVRHVEAGILIAGMLFALLRQAWWGVPAALIAWGLFRFVLWATTIMSCPHCDEMLWNLSRRLEDIKYCPYCGRRLDPDTDPRRR